MKKVILLFLIMMIAIACSSSQDSGVYTKSINVEDRLSKNIKAPWKKIDNEGSDFALMNKSTSSYFVFNSACRKFDPSNLPTLTNSILAGIDNVEFLEKTTTTHQDREAVLVIAKGAVDGVARFFRVLTTQKNNCIYDYALISTSKENLTRDTSDFSNFIQQLKLN